MAAFCDLQAGIHGEIETEGGTGGAATTGRELADRVATASGDCCVPSAKGKSSEGQKCEPVV